jgi:hypothetical protein
MRLTSERPVRGVGIFDGKPVGGRSQMTRPGSRASTASYQARRYSPTVEESQTLAKIATDPEEVR